MIILLVLAGIIGGIIGGMGMGGGTLLIPILTLVFGVDQYTAQAINLISFIPMSAVAIIIHFKHKLIKTEKIGYIILPAVISSVFASVLAANIDASALKSLFGIFLAVLGAVLLLAQILKDKPRETT